MAGLASAGACSWTCSWAGGSRQRARERQSIGFLRQTDAGSLLLGEDLGIYAKHGLSPRFHRAASPIELKDRLLSGELVAAQLPASLPIGLALADASGGDLVTLMTLSHNGAAITFGRDLCQGLKFLDLGGLRETFLRRTATTSVSVAVPVKGGPDDLLLRYLLAAAGVPPGRVKVVALPAEQMLADLREERIVGFAAPDPWPALAVAQDLGFTFATAQDICRTAPRSSLVTTPRALADRRPELKALIRNVIETSIWLDVPANRARPFVAEALARHQDLDLDANPIRARLGSVYDLGCRMGERDFENEMLAFHGAGRVNFPRRADHLLYLALSIRFGLCPPPQRPDVIDRTLSDELYREVAREMGVPLPDDMKPFIVTLDAVRFDPSNPAEWPRLWGAG